jgi:hypothetical protein
MKKLSTLLAGAALALFAASAFADNLVPPLRWDRGDPGSTWQEWEFLSDTTYAVPDAYVNPYGDPFALIADHAWIPVDVSGRQGIFSLSGLMAFYVPNGWPNPEPKLVHVQVTWRVTDPPYNPPADQPAPLTYLADQNGVRYDMTQDGELDLGNGWKLTVFDGEIPFNPPWEIIGLAGDIDVDQVVIDTFCPEPQTYGLLTGLGLLGFGVWRRMRS